MINKIIEVKNEADKSRKYLVEFSLKAKAKNIYLVGPFNCWFPGAHLMRKEGELWKISIEFYEGEYPYAFVLDGYKWILDPDNPLKTLDENRCKRSLLIVGDPDVLYVKGKINDGLINLKAIYHDQSLFYLNPLSKDRIIIKIRTLKNDVANVKFVYLNNEEKIFIMEKVFNDKFFDYYELELEVKNKDTIRYFFIINDGEKTVYLFENGIFEKKNFGKPFVFNLNKAKIFETPEWVKHAIFYQIFPDRFYNGDPNNDPQKTVKWNSKPTRSNFFGGDLKGIIEKLPYLKELGITAIYLTPIFKSKSNHKYDVIDYMKIDEHLGDIDILKELVSKAHENGIKIILDGVFNHSSNNFWAFKDILKNQEKSKYLNWYFIKKIPVKAHRPKIIELLLKLPLQWKIKRKIIFNFPPPYETFEGVTEMPKLNLLNPETKEYFLKIAEYWIKEVDIDGWRLDVANGIPHEFWKEFRKRIKNIKPDAYIMGEIWCNPSPWINGEEFDGTMNYPLRKIIIDFFIKNKINVEDFDSKLAQLRGIIPLQANMTMYNLIGSHDTARYLTLCKNDIDKMKLSIIFQMTYIGAPAIYYGDEIGLTGKGDPDCRKTMIWEKEKQDIELLEFYKKIIKIRKNFSALRIGKFKTLIKDNEKKIYAYKREDNMHEIIIILNNDLKTHDIRIDLEEGIYKDVLNEKEYTINKSKFLILNLKAKQGIILVREK